MKISQSQRAHSWRPGQPYPLGWPECPKIRRGDALLIWMGRGSGHFKNRYRIHFRCDDGKTGTASYGAWKENSRTRWRFHTETN